MVWFPSMFSLFFPFIFFLCFNAADGSDTTSHTNTFELYGPTKADAALYPVAASDDNRSYGTYDKSMDDFSDDYNREYEVGMWFCFCCVL